ncbi:hypothetical protein [Apilactobacillus bombintestini]|uniref:Membrane protein 6-pyruvoyl-tetrahydropterin synthase-related domain-containing protein n=1 Tax=Apilactobacillus bombintestini TaxID=2419772 RepID=A0A387AQH2_9LACO|nr:hypothetical protein [Apilactobacillus bombintestini]AYF92167.1 hypothetical protein D7I45_01005 [Apilactobacillus bombintestini]
MAKKINLENLYKIIRSNIFIVCMFSIISVLSGLYLLKSQTFGFTYDIYFHWQRIQEIKSSIGTAGFFSDVALNQFFQSGSAAMSMYPKINIIPMSIIALFVKSFFNLIYISFMLRNFLGLIIAYFACYTFNNNKKISFLFSLSYTISTTVLGLSFQITDIGMTSSLIYLPMVLFGTFMLINNYKWKELAIGISAISLCHVITAVMSALMVLFFIIANYGKLRDKKVTLSIFKAIVIALLISSIYWLPFSQLMSNNVVTMPYTTPALVGTDINTWLLPTFNNTVNQYITIFAVIGFILSIVRFKVLSKYSKQIFLLAILVLFIGSSFFPWNYLTHTFLADTFQSTWRVYIVPQLLLSYLFAEETVQLCKNKKENHIYLFSITIIIMLAQIVGQRNLVDYGRSTPLNYQSITRLYTDYLPQNSMSAFNDMNSHSIVYNNKKTTTRLLGNGKFAFKLDKSTKSLKMPFLIYNDIDYQVKVDDKNAKFHSDNHSQLTLGHINKGKHTVQVIVHKSWYDYLSYILSALGVIILGFAWIRSLILKRKNK